ncbi:hypothetical protein AVEN_72958-1 [Araneus ventricosus]|uniref:Uncharacterized protein n=1 Tax=Araneus ventricosus TaxID=182803 RepID=A0A4Y2X6Y9_ARAVE|nr:hypothetical protein AVEN_72958-1 [Araneus ventricosus]
MDFVILNSSQMRKTSEPHLPLQTSETPAGRRLTHYSHLKYNRLTYMADFQWNRVSNMEPSGSHAETLRKSHRGPRPRKKLCHHLQEQISLRHTALLFNFR